MKKPTRRRRGSAIFNIYEAKSQLSNLVDRAAKGEEIVIAKRGQPVARLGPLPRSPLKLGEWKGKIWIADDFDAPLPPEIQRYFDGDFDDFND